jgi:streptogramin lyase
MRRQVSAGIAMLTLALAAPVARADTTPEFFNTIGGQAAGQGLAADASGSIWFAQGQGTTAYLGHLDASQAVPGTSNGMSIYTTPANAASCCATAVRAVAVDDAHGRVWFARNEGVVGYADMAGVQSGTSSGMHSVVVPGGAALEGIAVEPDGSAWFTEYSSSNVLTNGDYPGDRLGHTDAAFAITQSTNIATQASSTLDPQRYDAKPSGIAIDAAGVPWFAESSPGLPGYRIAHASGTGYAEYLITPCLAQSPCSGSNTGTGPTGVAVAADSSIWFTNQVNNSIGRFDPVALTFTNYSLATLDHTLAGGAPRTIRTAVDGTLWVAEYGSNVSSPANAIVRVLPTGGGSISVYHLGASQGPVSIAPDTKGNVWFTIATSTGTAQIGRLAGVVGIPQTPGTSVPAPPPTPPPVQSSTPLTPSTVGTATLTNPAVHGTSLTANQICVGPPQDQCSLVYLIDTHEYVTGFPGAKASAATKKPKYKTVTVGKVTVTLKGGQSKKVTIKLNAKGRKLLKRYKKLPVNLTVTQKLDGGKTKVVKRAKATFKAPKKK